MTPELPPLPPVPMDCDGFRSRLTFRTELPPAERRSFDRHAAGCRPCAHVLLETERLDDLLLQWQAPGPTMAGAGSASWGRADAAADAAALSFEERVMKAVRGEGPTASCAESTASLHHYVAGDLEPWLAARVERHLAKCRECSDHLDEMQHSRMLWLAWKAPDARAGFADDLVRRLEPETRAARRRRALLELAFGAVRVPRAVAALLLVSVTLLSLGVLQMERAGLAGGGSSSAVIEHGTDGIQSAIHRTAIPLGPGQYAPAGRGDPTGSLSPEVRGGRNGSLREALRGE